MATEPFMRKLTKERTFKAPKKLRDQAKGQLINLLKAAQIMGLSREEFRKRVKAGIYPYFFDDKKGWYWFDEDLICGFAGLPLSEAPSRKAKSSQVSYVDETLKKPTAKTGGPVAVAFEARYDAAAGRTVFQALEAGKTPIQIVAELGVHPSQVRLISEDYHLMRGDLVVSAEIRARIEALPLRDATLPLTTELALLEALEKSLYAAPCEVCRAPGKRARVCGECANTRREQVAAAQTAAMFGGSPMQPVSITAASAGVTGVNGAATPKDDP